MKLLNTFGLCSVLLFVSACTTHNHHSIATKASPAQSLVGSWQLMHEEIRINGKTIPTFNPATHKMMKLFNDTHFAFVSHGDKRPRFTSYQLTPEEKVIAFENFGGGGGRYTFADGYLTEHIEYMNYPNYEGESIRFKITIDGDTLIQEGDYPITQLGLGDADGYLYSVFKRIE
jgi:hypothetical protein